MLDPLTIVQLTDRLGNAFYGLGVSCRNFRLGCVRLSVVRMGLRNLGVRVWKVVTTAVVENRKTFVPYRNCLLVSTVRVWFVLGPLMNWCRGVGLLAVLFLILS